MTATRTNGPWALLLLRAATLAILAVTGGMSCAQAQTAASATEWPMPQAKSVPEGKNDPLLPLKREWREAVLEALEPGPVA